MAVQSTLCAQWECDSVHALQEQARLFAQTLDSGDVILLHGVLGAGKTTFTQGLALGLGIDEPVLSPTFTLSRLYTPHIMHNSSQACDSTCSFNDTSSDASNNVSPGLMHIDLYRLLDASPPIENHIISHAHDHTEREEISTEFRYYWGNHIESLDVEEYLTDSVIVIEWGRSVAEIFTTHWYDIELDILESNARKVTIWKVAIQS